MKYDSWKILSRYPKNPIQAILDNRLIKDSATFFNPKYDSLPKASSFPALKSAADVIRNLKKSGGKIGLFMDYDADGICGGSILFKALESLEIKVEAYIPKREEGYGLSRHAVEHFKRSKVNLLICVDCGIRNNIEIALAKELGIETIIVDHHQITSDLPKALVIVHPQVKNKLKFREYSGGGVAYLLARELYRESGQEKWLIDLATISSVADVVPLQDVNRTIIKFGMMVINKTRNLGLRKMIEKAGLKLGEISPYEVGFMIAPRINAAGRVSDPHKSFELLTTADPKIAADSAVELEELNLERQRILESTQQEAIKIVESKKLFSNRIIILKKTNWNEGVIGLVASRLVEKYFKPCIVLSQRGNLLKGSARSIPGINITNLIGKAEKHLMSFGGHSQAAGISLKSDNFEKVNKKINLEAKSISESLFKRVLKVDVLLEMNKINLSVANYMDKMQPFGPANPRPVFAFENVKISSLSKIGKEQNHYKFALCQNIEQKYCIAFRAKENNLEIKNGDIVDIAFTVKSSVWQGEKKLDLIVEDVQKK